MKLSELFYSIIGWVNYPDTSTPVGKTNLRHMDNGILQCAQYILGLSQDKLEVSDAAKFITGWEVDTSTWIVTVTHNYIGFCSGWIYNGGKVGAYIAEDFTAVYA